MRWSFLGLSDIVDADAGPPEDADIAAATVRAREAFALCTRLPCSPCNHNLGDFAERLQDG
jgi:hypothetical protein